MYVYQLICDQRQTVQLSSICGASLFFSGGVLHTIINTIRNKNRHIDEVTPTTKLWYNILYIDIPTIYNNVTIIASMNIDTLALFNRLFDVNKIYVLINKLDSHVKLVIDNKAPTTSHRLLGHLLFSSGSFPADKSMAEKNVEIVITISN